MCSVVFSSSDGSRKLPCIYLHKNGTYNASPAIQIAPESSCRRFAAALTLSCLNYGRSCHRSAPNLLNEP